MQISWKKKIIFALLANIIFAAAFLLTAEALMRFAIHFRYGHPGKRYGIYQSDAELGAVHRPNSYNTNSVMNNRGFRNIDDIQIQKTPGALRVYCSGGSTVFCYNLPTERAWPSVLQRKLRNLPGHAQDEVLNAGEICFSLAHEFALAKRFIPVLKPDIVLLYSLGTNEGANAASLHREGYSLETLFAEKRWGLASKKLDQARFLKRNSILLKFLDYRIKAWIEKRLTGRFRQEVPAGPVVTSVEKPHPWLIYNFDTTLRAYIRFLRSNGARVIIVRFGDSGIHSWYLDNYVLMFRERAVRIAKEEGAEVCNLAYVVEKVPQPQRKDLYISSGIHVTDRGADVVADVLAECILKK